MIAIDEKRVESLIIKYQPSIKRQTSAIIRRLNALYLTLNDQSFRDYVDGLRTHRNILIGGSQQELARLKIYFDNILIIDPQVAGHINFKNSVIAALGYTNHRDNFYPKYFRDLGIKSCVYCNAQLCVAVAEKDGHIRAKFEVDHYISKDKYPCFSVALFNLYPACKSCNNIKSTKRVDFVLYKRKQDIGNSDFEFKLLNKDATVAAYISKPDLSAIKISFKEPTVVAPVEKFDSVFAIVEIYNTQIDIIGDLIAKNYVYNDTYRQELKDKFPELFPNDKTLNQYILGNYIEEGEIHNRPMAKFQQDIARQLGLIE